MTDTSLNELKNHKKQPLSRRVLNDISVCVCVCLHIVFTALKVFLCAGVGWDREDGGPGGKSWGGGNP